MQNDRVYLAIDLKSFYASYECAIRGLDPLKTHLVVADLSRSEKTICLAISPSLKEYGLPGRARLFEVISKVKEINKIRKKNNHNLPFKGKSSNVDELKKHPEYELDYLVATPQMGKYIEVSTKIYSIYLKYIAKEDIHVYSIDEVFIDVTSYLKTYKSTPHDLAKKLIKEVLKETGITATAGIGTNMYLAKVAMDIVAKHMPADKDGVRIAELDEKSYRYQLWEHRPFTDFWRVGHGISRKLEAHGMYTMGDVALQSKINEDKLYELFGINAELLIDHAWGYEPTLISDIKSYVPDNNSLSIGQVLSSGYEYKKALLIVKEMADALSLDLVNKDLITNQIVLGIGYDKVIEEGYDGEIEVDYIGRNVPKGGHGSISLERFTSSSSLIIEAAKKLFKNIANPHLLVRRVYLAASHVVDRKYIKELNMAPTQLDLFMDYDTVIDNYKKAEEKEEKDYLLNKTLLKIKNTYGKNAVIKGMDLEEGATTKERNNQIGGHRR